MSNTVCSAAEWCPERSQQFCVHLFDSFMIMDKLSRYSRKSQLILFHEAFTWQWGEAASQGRVFAAHSDRRSSHDIWSNHDKRNRSVAVNCHDTQSVYIAHRYGRWRFSSLDVKGNLLLVGERLSIDSRSYGNTTNWWVFLSLWCCFRTKLGLQRFSSFDSLVLLMVYYGFSVSGTSLRCAFFFCITSIDSEFCYLKNRWLRQSCYWFNAASMLS